MADMTMDATDFLNKSKALQARVKDQSKVALGEVADGLLLLSQSEVPHNKGKLADSGHVAPDGDDYLVGYNKVYAMRLHEHPEYRFQKGRKGKYLEDPLKLNTHILSEYYIKKMKEVLR